MNYSRKNLLITSCWNNRPLIGSEYVDWLNGFLMALKEVDTCFSTLWAGVQYKYVSIRSDLSNLGEVVAISQPKDWVFKSPDSDIKAFTMSSRPMSCFRNDFYTTLDSDPLGCSITVSAGSHMNYSPDCAVIQISDGLVSPVVAKAIFKTAIAYCRADFGYSIRSDVIPLIGQPNGQKRIGWLTYLDDPQVINYLPGNIPVEPFNSGVIIQAGEAPCKPEDVESVDKLRQILSALEPHGLLFPPQIKKVPR